MYTINNATNQIFDIYGNTGIFAGGDPVYEAYQAWHLADTDAHQINTVYLPAPEVPSREISRLEFMNLFQDAELAAICSTAKVSVAVEIWLEKFKLSEFVNLDDPRTAGGIHALEQSGLLGVGRAAEILG